MKKTAIAAIALGLISLSTIANAGTYGVGHSQDCPALRQKQVFDTINQVGIEEGLDLPKNRRIAGEMRCFRHQTLDENGASVYMYMFRVTIEKLITDDGVQQWVKAKPDLERVGYGIKTADGLPVEMQQETRKLIRMLGHK